MSLLWRSTHCRGRRKVEEYSSLEVPDSDNNSTKESVEFSEPSFRTNFAESLGSRFPISHFPLKVTSRQRERERRSHFRTQRVSWCVLFERSGALFIALREGYFGPNPTKQLQQFGLNRCNGSFQPQQPPKCLPTSRWKLLQDREREDLTSECRE